MPSDQQIYEKILRQLANEVDTSAMAERHPERFFLMAGFLALLVFGLTAAYAGVLHIKCKNVPTSVTIGMGHFK